MSLNFGIHYSRASHDVKAKFQEMLSVHSKIENQLIEYALEYGLALDLTQGSLVHDNTSDGYYRHERGEWFTSTDSCS